MKLEIERKFLLKSMPDIPPAEMVKIDQFYLKNASGTWERARSWDSNTKGKSWIHTVKKSVSKGVNLEDEKFLIVIFRKDFKKKASSFDETFKLLLIKYYSFVTLISTLLLFALPALVLFVSIGFASPKPEDSNLEASIPFSAKYV